jgi:hypothetical protein
MCEHGCWIVKGNLSVDSPLDALKTLIRDAKSIGPNLAGT